MGFFSGIKDKWKKAEAAVIVQNLLEMQVNMGLLQTDPKQAANELVGETWNLRPEYFNGSRGQRPHKIVVAATAFTVAIEVNSSSPRFFRPFLFCLGQIIMEVQRASHLYPFSALDHHLLEEAINCFQKYSAELETLGA